MKIDAYLNEINEEVFAISDELARAFINSHSYSE